MANVMAVVEMTGFSVVALLHSIGLLVLCKAKWKLQNQKTLSLNLVLVEMMYAYNMVVIDIMLLSKVKISDWIGLDLFLTFFISVLFTEIRLAVLHIIMDRFMEIHMSLKYPIYMPPRKMKTLIAFLWILGLVFGLAITICTSFEPSIPTDLVERILSFRSLILDIFILVSSIVTYLYFYSAVKKIRSLGHKSRVQSQEKRTMFANKKFKIPCIIVTTYLCFNFIATMLLIASDSEENRTRKNLLIDIAIILDILGLLSDIFTYIFLKTNVLSLFHELRNNGIGLRKTTDMKNN